MKTLTRIRMVPFGVLADVTVDLAPGLTVVYGVNEAGKSTLLAALSAAITGMPSRGVHGVAPSHLRIDVTVSDGSTGATPEQVYRRGIQGFLRYPEMTPDTCPWEATVAGQPDWLTTHGLSHQRLREGGRQLFEGTGDLADVIFEAHEGFSARALLDELQARADRLFSKDGRRASEIQEELKQIASLEDEYKQRLVDPETIERLRLDVHAAEQKDERARSDLAQARRRREQATADRTAYPDIQAAVAIRAEMEQTDRGLLLSRDEIEAVHAAERTQEEQSIVIDGLSQGISDLEKEIEASPAQDPILEDAEEVSGLHSDLKVATATRTGAAAAREKAQVAQDSARSVLAQLGIHLASDDPVETRTQCVAVHLADDVIASLDEALDAHEQARSQDGAAQEAVATAERDLQAHEHKHPSAAGSPDAQASGLAATRQERDGIWLEAREALVTPEGRTPEERGRLAERFEAAELRADEAADAAIEQAGTDATRAGLELALAHAGANAARTARALDAADSSWAALARQAGLPPAVTPAGWPTRRDLIGLLAGHLDAWDREGDAAARQEREWHDFERRVKAVASNRSVTGSTAEQVAELHKRLAAAQKDERSLSRNRKDLAHAQAALAAAQELLASAAAQVDVVIAQHQISEPADLATRLSDSEHYYALCEDHETTIGRLMLAYERSEALIDDAFSRLEARTQEEVEDAVRLAEDAEEALESEQQDRYGELKAARDAEQSALDSDGDVMRAQALKNARASLGELAEEYAITTIQARLLAGHLERLFADRGSATLIRAGELLERLTGGRYVALASQERADGARSLRVVKRDRGDCSLAELSEGTADQAFLALRLAGLETRHQRQAEAGLVPVPIVLDDVLLTFDDERTQAALATLQGWAADKQVILTTHHERVRDLAAALGIACTELPGPPSFEALGTTEEIRQTTARPQFAQRAAGVARAPEPGADGAVDTKAIRAWAEQEGLIPAGRRGTLSREIMELHRRAHT